MWADTVPFSFNNYNLRVIFSRFIIYSSVSGYIFPNIYKRATMRTKPPVESAVK